MTKKELFEMLENIDDDTRIFIINKKDMGVDGNFTDLRINSVDGNKELGYVHLVIE